MPSLARKIKGPPPIRSKEVSEMLRRQRWPTRADGTFKTLEEMDPDLAATALDGARLHRWLYGVSAMVRAAVSVQVRE